MSEDEERKYKKAYRRNMVIVAVMAVLLFGSIIFSAVQTVYIFKLNTGLVGNHEYLSDDQNGAQKPDELSSDDGDLPEPWFSLEEAASVSSADKKALKVTEIVDLVNPATISLYIKQTSGGQTKTVSSGSGFIITEDGYAVTNAHVVENAQKSDSYSVYASLPGRNELVPCEVIGSDVQTDCAVIKLAKGQTYPKVTLGKSSDLRSGELVVAIGNALGTLDGTVTVGVVSAVNRVISHEGYRLGVLQTDAAINTGNSGGPLINSFGEVIGITNAKMIINASEGLGFAIPIDTVKPVIESIINYGKVVNRAFLGVTVSYVAENAYVGAEPGVFVAEYIEGGPADQAGLRIGDKIISIDGVAINRTDDIIDIRDAHSVGDKVVFTIERDGKKIDIDFVIGDSADYTNSETVSQDSGSSESKDEGTDQTDIFGAKK